MCECRFRRFVLLVSLVWLLGSCGPRYLSEPPPKFDDYVDDISGLAPSGATLLSEYSARWTSPKEICTGFASDYLYGTDDSYLTVVQSIELGLEEMKDDYVKVNIDADYVSYVLSNVATVGVYQVTNDDQVAEMRHGVETVSGGQEEYETLFGIAMEHSYGNCAPHPWWNQ
jgi:hypothetical protein